MTKVRRVAKTYTIGGFWHRLWLKTDYLPDWLWWLAPALSWVLCKAQGHVVDDDQCNKPEHRFCTTCNRPAPNKPRSVLAGSKWKVHRNA